MTGAELGIPTQETVSLFPFIDSVREIDAPASEDLCLILQNEQLGLILPEDQSETNHALGEAPEQVVLFSSEELSLFDRGRFWRIQRNRNR